VSSSHRKNLSGIGASPRHLRHCSSAIAEASATEMLALFFVLLLIVDAAAPWIR
jgi:hypothetical protein